METSKPTSKYPELNEIGITEDEVFAIADETLQLVKRYYSETEENDWKFLKAKSKGKDQEKRAWKKDVAGASTPIWKASGHLRKLPENYVAVFFEKYLEAAGSSMAIAELRILANVAPNIRVVYIRVRGKFGFCSREIYMIQGMYKENDHYYFYEKSIPTRLIPPKKDVIRAHIGIIGGVLTPSPDTNYKTNITGMMQTDLGGLLPKMFYNYAEVSFHVLSFWNALEKKIASDRKLSWSPQEFIAKAEHNRYSSLEIKNSFSSSFSSSSSDLKISSASADSNSSSSSSSSSSSLSGSTEEKKDIRLELFLKELELEKYLVTFEKEEVSYRILLDMEEKDLQDLGIPFGPRRALVKAINAMKAKDQGINQVYNVQVLNRIGHGSFGEVYEGLWNETTRVALKRLHEKSEFEKFRKEASLLQSMVHPSIIRFYGVYTSLDGDPFIVTELMPLGNLKDLLCDDPYSITTRDLIILAKETVAGLLYLSSHKVVHRDLAARNLLVGETNGKYTVKISDFGLSRSVESDYYSISTESKFPVKWTAPEVFETRKYTVESDIWSFGVVCWEMFSYGEEPYDGVSNKDVLQRLKQSQFLACPQSCPQIIYEELILPCFNLDPEKRPNYKELYRRLCNIEEFLGPAAPVQKKEEVIRYNNTPDEAVYKDASEDIGSHNKL